MLCDLRSNIFSFSTHSSPPHSSYFITVGTTSRRSTRTTTLTGAFVRIYVCVHLCLCVLFQSMSVSQIPSLVSQPSSPALHLLHPLLTLPQSLTKTCPLFLSPILFLSLLHSPKTSLSPAPLIRTRPSLMFFLHSFHLTFLTLPSLIYLSLAPLFLPSFCLFSSLFLLYLLSFSRLFTHS
jgi:hypothetical protein